MWLSQTEKVKLLWQKTPYFLQAIAAGTPQPGGQPSIYDAVINTNIEKFLVKVSILNYLCAMTHEGIAAKCIAVKHEGQLNVMKM